jgi:hypothetical protein
MAGIEMAAHRHVSLCHLKMSPDDCSGPLGLRIGVVTGTGVGAGAGRSSGVATAAGSRVGFTK